MANSVDGTPQAQDSSRDDEEERVPSNSRDDEEDGVPNDDTSPIIEEVAETEPPNPQLELIGPAYASITPPFVFWIELVAIAVQSSLLGMFALGYLNVVYEIPKLWLAAQGNDAYPNDPSTTGFLDGKPFWIAIGSGTGLIVGVLKAYVFKFDEYPGFIEDLLALDAEPVLGFKVTTVCLVSLMGGASLGPESGLGAACGGMSIVYARLVNSIIRKLEKQEDIDEPILAEEETIRRKLIVLCGMVAAFSTILPSPASAILLCLELVPFERLFLVHGLEYVKTIVLLTFGGTISFLVYTSLESNTFLPSARILPGFLHEYENFDIVLGLSYGLMGAVLTLIYFVVAGVVKLMTRKAKQSLEHRFGLEARVLIMAVIGGTLFGLLGYIFPLTVGDGSYQISAVVTRGNQIESKVLVASTFAKMLSFWISNETGFVGGLFFPLLIMPTMFGRMIVNETDASIVVSLACSLVAMAAAFTPMPIAMMIVAMSTYNLSARGSIPVLVSVVTAHMLLAGIGFPQAMLKRAAKNHSKEG